MCRSLPRSAMIVEHRHAPLCQAHTYPAYGASPDTAAWIRIVPPGGTDCCPGGVTFPLLSTVNIGVVKTFLMTSFAGLSLIPTLLTFPRETIRQTLPGSTSS